MLHAAMQCKEYACAICPDIFFFTEGENILKEQTDTLNTTHTCRLSFLPCHACRHAMPWPCGDSTVATSLMAMPAESMPAMLACCFPPSGSAPVLPSFFTYIKINEVHNATMMKMLLVTSPPHLPSEIEVSHIWPYMPCHAMLGGMPLHVNAIMHICAWQKVHVCFHIFCHAHTRQAYGSEQACHYCCMVLGLHACWLVLLDATACLPTLPACHAMHAAFCFAMPCCCCTRKPCSRKEACSHAMATAMPVLPCHATMPCCCCACYC